MESMNEVFFRRHIMVEFWPIAAQGQMSLLSYKVSKWRTSEIEGLCQYMNVV